MVMFDLMYMLVAPMEKHDKKLRIVRIFLLVCNFIAMMVINWKASWT